MSRASVLWLRPPKGKVSVRRERIAEHLRPRGFEVDLRDTTSGNLLSATAALVRGEYDVLIGNVRAGLYAGYPMATATRTPFVADVSDPISDIDDLPAPLFRVLDSYESWILTRAKEAVYVPQVYRSAVEDGFEGRVAPNAVDFEKFAHPDEDVVNQSADILATEGVDPNRPIALYVGVLSAGRNIETILEAAERVPEWQVVFVGEGEISMEVEQAAESEANVFWPGAFEHDLMPGFMTHATVGFCLVDIERPIKIAEYGAAGLPVLGIPGKLQAEFSDEEICFVDPTPDAVATALSRLGDAPERRQSYAAALRADAREHSWSSVADVYEATIEARLGR
jgi:glycosyltransferase involved in cell wall biosynthesis